MDEPRFEIFVDGGCSMCSRESRWMRSLDRGRGHLRVTDINSTAFARADHGITFDQAMRTIHGRHPDGRVIHGVAVFRAAYGALGLGWLWAPTRLPGVRQLVDVVYAYFARMRYRRRMRQTCAVSAR